MKIVIVSDTHGDTYALQQVLLREQKVDLFLHAGDVVAPKEAISPFAAVRGNCDGYYRQDYPVSYEYMTPLGKLHMEHIHTVLEAKIPELKDNGIKIVIHGHTHVRREEVINGVYVFCPGSLTYPRDNDVGTYLVLEVTEDGVKPTFKEIE